MRGMEVFGCVVVVDFVSFCCFWWMSLVVLLMSSSMLMFSSMIVMMVVGVSFSILFVMVLCCLVLERI